MYTSKIFQAVPNAKITISASFFKLLVIVKRNPQIICYGLLGHAFGPSGGFQVFSHPLHLPAVRYGRLLFLSAAQASAPDSKKKTMEQEKEIKGSDHIGGTCPGQLVPPSPL